MIVKLDTAAAFPFSTRDPTTGAAADADSLPTAVVEENGTNVVGTDIAVAKKAGTTGQYNVTLTAANAQFVKASKYTVRVTATVGGVTDEAPIATFEVGVEAVGNSLDSTQATVEGNILAAIPSAADIWSYTEAIAGTKDAFEIICMAAAGAGAGRLSIQGHTPGTTRDETFLYPDESTTAFVVTVDSEGARTNITFP